MATKQKNLFQKSSFFLNGPAFIPPPSLDGLAISGGIIFFCGFPFERLSENQDSL